MLFCSKDTLLNEFYMISLSFHIVEHFFAQKLARMRNNT